MGISKGEPPTKKRKRTGGIRQRIAAADAAEAERSSSSSRGQSTLAKFLVESWAKGELSPQKVQQIAELAMRDMSQVGNVQFKTLEKLAALGNHGATAQNCHRDLLALAKPYSKLPQPSLHSIHFKKKTSVQGIFLPHEIFASLFHDYQETWKDVILPHHDKLIQFWKVAKNHPCMEGHPLEGSEQQWAIPLSLHGDGVPTSGAGKVSCKMFTNFSWASLLGEASTALMQQYIWGLVDSVGNQQTLDDFFFILAWSFTCLFHGTWPAADHLGQPYAAGSLEAARAGCQLAGGYRGILFGILGDLDYLASTLGLPRWNKKNDFCCLCKPLGGLPWEDFRLGACEWVDQQWLVPSWRIWPQKPKNALFSVPGVTALNVCYDYMHCKFLGTDQVLFGGCLYILCNHCMDGSPDENVLVLWEELKSFQKSSSVRHPCKFLGRTSMFTRKKGPHKLRGKAAEVSCFGPSMLHLWELYSNQDDPWHKKIGIMLKLSIQCEDIIHCAKGDLSLDAQSAERLTKAIFALFHLQLGVAQHFRETGNHQLFTVTPKAHFLCHIALLSKFISPRLSWCFKGEDMMKKVRTLATHCFKRLSAMEAPNKIARHYRIAHHFAMSNVDRL